MADDLTPPQRRSRPAPPPPPTAAGAGASSYRAQSSSSSATPSRFGFGSSSSRSAAFGSSTAARSTTFSSSAFGRSVTARPARPSSAESSRLRQKPTTVTASASSAPKKSTTDDFFPTTTATKSAQPRAGSAGSLPMQSASASSSLFASSYAPATTTTTAAAAKPSGQFFSMDDSDLGGDDGWGVDSPSNILSPASATDETAAPTTSATMTFEEDDEFGWVDEASPQAPPPPSAPIPVVAAPVCMTTPPQPSPPKDEAAAAPVASSSGWGDEFGYSADATEALADEGAWNDDDVWGTMAPNVNGGATAAADVVQPVEALAKAKVPAVEPLVSTAQTIQAPPLSTASADLGAILSPSGQAGEFWGDEGDDDLFDDDEPAEATQVETRLPDVGSLSLHSEPAHVEPVDPSSLPSPAGDEFSCPEFESNVVAADVDAESEQAAWGNETNWHEETAAAEDVEQSHEPSPFEATQVAEPQVGAQADYADDEEQKTEESSSAVDYSSHFLNEFAAPADTAFDATSPPVNEFAYSHGDAGDSSSSAVDAREATSFDKQAQYAHAQQHASAEAQQEYFGYQDQSSYSYDQAATTADAHSQQYESPRSLGFDNVHTAGDARVHAEDSSAVEASVSSDHHYDHQNGFHGETVEESIQRQVSWETEEDKSATTLEKDAEVDHSFGTLSASTPPLPPTKAEVSFGSSSFGAAELTYGHYHHDHHRTPSEAEVGSVASFAEASSAGATFGGSDNVSDGTYSDGDYAPSETRSAFGSSTADTAFITEPPSSSDGQDSVEENDQHSDISSTVGASGGAFSSEFDVSSTRSAAFENEVTNSGFEPSEHVYTYEEHASHERFGGNSYEDEFSRGGSHSTHSHDFEHEQTSASARFGSAEEASFTSNHLSLLAGAQRTASPNLSQSSTPATDGVSSVEDLPTASDLEFEHSETENLFASSSSDCASSPFGTVASPVAAFEERTEPVADMPFSTSHSSSTAPPVTDAAVQPVSHATEPAVEEDANPFASSSGSVEFATAPPNAFAPPSEVSQDPGSFDALPSASSLFGESPAKGSPFGSFTASHRDSSQPAFAEETPLADARALFADAPAASAFGGFEQPSAAPAPSFCGGEQTAYSQHFGYDSSSQHFGYDNQSNDHAFGGNGQSSEFDNSTYGYDTPSYQTAGDEYGGDSHGYEGAYTYEASSHQSAGEALGAPPHVDHNGNGFGGYDSASVAADDFFGGGSSSAADVFGSSGDSAFQNEWVGEQSQYEQSGYSSEHDSHASQYATPFAPTPLAEATFDLTESEVAHSTPEPEISTVDPHALHAAHSEFDSSPLAASSDHVGAGGHDVPHAVPAAWPDHASNDSNQVQDQHESTATAMNESHASYDHNEFYSSEHHDATFATSGKTDSFFGQSASAPSTDPFGASDQHSFGQTSHGSFDASEHSLSAPPRASSSSFDARSTEHRELPPSPKSEPASAELSTHDSGAFPVEPSASSSGPFEAPSDAFSGPSRDNFGAPSSDPFGAPASGAFGAPASDAFGGSAETTEQQSHGTIEPNFGDSAGVEASAFGGNGGEAYPQADPSAFFGGHEETSGPFGGGSSNDASGFFSGGPAQHHRSGGIYAQPPQLAAPSSYDAFNSTTHGHYQDGHGAYSSPPNDFAASDSRAYDAPSLAAPTTPVQQDTGFGGQLAPASSHFESSHSTSHEFGSAAAGGASHFASSVSHPGYTGGASAHHGYQETHHQNQYDASYQAPAARQSASPPTLHMQPTPLQAAAAKPAYNQAALAPAKPARPSYTNFAAGASVNPPLESKPAYASPHAAGVGALSSTKYKDPNMVVPSCLASFGFGGNVVTMFPKQKLRLVSATIGARSSPRTPMSMQHDNAPQAQGELRKGPVGIYRMDHVHPKNNEFEELDKFPGPLNENVSEDAILQYVQDKMGSGGSSPADEDERLLLGVLRVLIKCNGRLRSEANANPNDPGSPEVQLVSLLKESDQRRRRNQPTHFPPPKPVQYSTHADATLRNASRVRELLLLGDRKAAVDVAIQAQMWPEAMLIGSFTDKDEYKRVLCAYFSSHYAPGDPCRALYLSFADQQERSVHEPQKLMQQGAAEDSSAILSTWVVHVQMLLANRTADTNKILVELGDRLWKEANAVVAAHVCYLLAGITVEAPSPSSKIALLGADHRSPDEARFYVSPSAVQRTEIYEWIQKKVNPAATNMIPFQGYKLIYAMVLADHGKLETAFKYVNSMLTVIRAITATMKPGTSMYLEGMQNQLVVLDDRLRQHLGQDRADSVAAAASAKQGKWGLGSALSIMGKIVNRVVEGNDAPPQNTAPRSSNGSLFQGAPRSTTINAAPSQPEYPSGAAVGYSSQPASGPVHAAPGSGRGGAAFNSQQPLHNSVQPPAAAHQPQAPSYPQSSAIPAAFNVPRPHSTRNLEPPQHSTPDYAAPLSNGGVQASAAPLSGSSGNAFGVPPPHQTQQNSGFQRNAFNAPPSTQAPPPFQKPSLDLSGEDGKSGFGQEQPPALAPAGLAKPKSPRSPRDVADGPGSDKGASSPKVKDTKKGGRSKTPPPSRSSSGWLSGLSTFLVAKMNPDAKVAKLGEHMDAYFDEEKKRWVFPGETQSEEPTMPSAPPTGPLPGSTPASMSGGPHGGPPGTHSAPGSIAGGAASNDPLAALMAPPPARAHATLMKKDPLSAMMAPPPNRSAFGQRSGTMPAKRPPPRPQFAVFKPAPGSTTSSAPGDLEPSPSNEWASSHCAPRTTQ